MKTSKESFIAIYNEEKQLIGIIHKGETRTNTFYKVEEMDQDELSDLINN